MLKIIIESEINVKVESKGTHLSNFGYSMQIFQVRPVALAFLEFRFLCLFLLYIVASLSHQNAQETPNLFQLFILRQVYGRSSLSLLAFFTSSF